MEWQTRGFHGACNPLRAKFGVSKGDVIEATAIGNVISGYCFSPELAVHRSCTFPTGLPGMGTYWGPGTNTDFGLSDFRATDQFTVALN